jgi:hypothetical protein
MAKVRTVEGVGIGWKPELSDQRDYIFEDRSAHLMKTMDQLRAIKQTPDPKLLGPRRDQHAEGSCHRADTEVLTELGWMPWPKITGEERLATVDPNTRKMIFERPVRLFRYHYVGPLVCVRNRSIDFGVTPDHKMLVRKWDESKRMLANEFSFVPAKDLGWYSGLLGSFETGAAETPFYDLPARPEDKHVAQRSPRRVSMCAWLRFLGLYLAEGTICRRAARERRIKDEWRVQIAGVKDRERLFIAETLDAIGVKATVFEDRFVFHDMQVVQALWDLGLGGVKAGRKFAPAFVFQQSAEHIRDFLLGHFMGDGCSHADTVDAHYTSSSRLADDLQALVVMSGRMSTLSVREARSSVTADGRAITGTPPEHKISVRRREDPSLDRGKHIFTEQYAGEVFCAEVPTHHTLVTRRNGRVLVAGNCTGHGSASAANRITRQDNDRFVTVYSPRSNYNWARILEAGKVDFSGDLPKIIDPGPALKEDNGAYVRDAVLTIRKVGALPESAWKYRAHIREGDQAPGANDYKVVPSASRIQAAHSFRVEAQRCETVEGFLSALAAGFPVVFGHICFTNMWTSEVDRTGVFPLAGGRPDGGHCQCAHWFDLDFKVPGAEAGVIFNENSWSENYAPQSPTGIAGMTTMPVEFLRRKWADDCWAVVTEVP